MITTNSKDFERPEEIPSLLQDATPLVRGGVYLLDGAAGTGKSTILLFTAADLVKRGFRVLWVCGEENAAQVIDRCKRLDITEDIGLSEVAIAERIISDVEAYQPDVVIVDSLQSIQKLVQDGIVGGTRQVRESLNAMIDLAKSHTVTIILVGQQTKAGAAAGSQVIIHAVDTHLTLYKDRLRGIVRGIKAQKNRFGGTDGIAFFNMKDGKITIN